MNKLKSVFVGVIVGAAVAMSTYQNIQLNSIKHKVENAASYAADSKDNTSKIIEEMTRANKCALNPQCLKIAEAIYFESGNNSKADKLAIANVIKNRLYISGNEDESYISIITERNKKHCQFSYLCVRKNFLIEDGDMWKDSVEAASEVFYNLVEDTTNGATHYYAHKKLKKDPWPKMKRMLRTDVHTFKKENK